MTDLKAEKPVVKMVQIGTGTEKLPTFKSGLPLQIDKPRIDNSSPKIREVITSDGSAKVIDFDNSTPPYFETPIVEVGGSRFEIHHFMPSNPASEIDVKPNPKNLALYWTDDVRVLAVSIDPAGIYFQGKSDEIPQDLAQMHVGVDKSDFVFIEKYQVMLGDSVQKEVVLSRVCSDSKDLNDSVLKSVRWLVK